MTAAVRVTRGGITESEHRIHAAVVDDGGELRARVGDPERVAFFRSAAKPVQALPLVDDGVADRFGIPASELALCCGSHSGEPRHVEGVRSILAKAGLEEDALECGPHRPLAEEASDRLASEGHEPGPIHNNCSGKHAGMLALASHHGWGPEDYTSPDHPVQRRMLREVSRWSDLPARQIGTGVDGCGVVCFAMPVTRMARTFARLTAAANRGGSPAQIFEAMARHPFHVAGSGRLCTRLMERAGTRVVAKTGAEGVYCAGLRSLGWGVALKVEDGARRASETALLRILLLLGVLDEADREALEPFVRQPVENTRGARVGEVRAEFELEEMR